VCNHALVLVRLAHDRRFVGQADRTGRPALPKFVPIGIFVAPFEQGEIGPDLFRAACRMGLEGLVSKRRDRPYQAGRSKHWIKMKNRSHPAMD
jgi:hypothetical protein